MMRLLTALMVLALAGCATAPVSPVDFAPMVATTSCNQTTCRWDNLEDGNGPAETMTGIWICQVYGTWGGATLTMQRYRVGDGSWVSITGPAAMVGATADTAWVEFHAGSGRFRPIVSGGTGETLYVECGRMTS